MNDLELEEKFQELLELVGMIKNPKLKAIALELLLEHKEKIMKRAGSPDRFENNKYQKGNHHFYKGGLVKPVTVEAKIVRFAERLDCMLSHYLMELDCKQF